MFHIRIKEGTETPNEGIPLNITSSRLKAAHAAQRTQARMKESRGIYYARLIAFGPGQFAFKKYR
jgi:hypothetical protein